MSVVIVGGGIAGATLALALSQLTQGQLSIDLIEAKPLAEHHDTGFDSRSLVLAEGTCQMLAQLGIWQVIEHKAEAIKTIQTSEQGHAGLVTFSARAFKLPAFGRVIELSDVGKGLASLLRQQPNIRLHCPVHVVDIERTLEAVALTLNNGQQLSGKLAIAADGAHSLLAEQLNIPVNHSDYRQVAIIANVRCATPKTGWAFERFTPQGPLALLPMINQRHSLVWCHHSAEQYRVERWSDDEFIHHLQHAFGWHLGPIEKVSEHHAYPLALQYRTQHISHRVAFVGNASQTLHPIAGQGFNLGLRDVMALANVVNQAIQSDEDIGSYVVLDRYQQARLADQQKMVTFTDGLVRLFSSDNLLLTGVRNLAMFTLDQSSCLQRQLIKQAMGEFKR